MSLWRVRDATHYAGSHARQQRSTLLAVTTRCARALLVTAMRDEVVTYRATRCTRVIRYVYSSRASMSMRDYIAQDARAQ